MEKNALMRSRQITAIVMAVLVVYERGLAEVAAWTMLRSWLQTTGPDGSRSGARVLIYDNSAAERARPLQELPGCLYVHDPNNGGTAAAYACATRVASEIGVEWLLLLDHDTSVPEHFLEEAATTVFSGSASAAAWVPWVRLGNGAIISPVKVTWMGGFRPLHPGVLPSSGMHLSAIASGSLLRVASMRELLPWPKGLWLDYVDHWIFAQLHRRGLQTLILNQVLQQELSITAPKSLSPARLVSILNGEVIFQGLLGTCARLVYPWRLAWRVLRLARSNPGLAVHALKWIAVRRLYAR
jgi:hypothetical protein